MINTFDAAVIVWVVGACRILRELRENVFTVRPLAESILRGHRHRDEHTYECVGRAFDCEVGTSDGEHARATTNTDGEEEYVQVHIATRFDLTRTQMIDNDCDDGPSGRGKQNEGPARGQPEGFPCFSSSDNVKATTRSARPTVDAKSYEYYDTLQGHKLIVM